MTATTPQAVTSAAPTSAAAEHIYIASDDAEPAAGSAQTLAAKHVIANRLRHNRTELTVYLEGALKVTEYRRDKRTESYLLDLKYLDPVPEIERIVAKSAVRAALSLLPVAGLGVLLARFGIAPAVLLSIGLAAFAAALGCVLVALHRSYERTVFYTIHGRAEALVLRANVGAIKHARTVVPAIANAIEEQAETIGTDTAAFLRAEMREHYRLRKDGVLSESSCAQSTGRILAQFDVQF